MGTDINIKDMEETWKKIHKVSAEILENLKDILDTLKKRNKS